MNLNPFKKTKREPRCQTTHSVKLPNSMEKALNELLDQLNTENQHQTAFSDLIVEALLNKLKETGYESPSEYKPPITGLFKTKSTSTSKKQGGGTILSFPTLMFK